MKSFLFLFYLLRQIYSFDNSKNVVAKVIFPKELKDYYSKNSNISFKKKKK